MFSDPTLGTQLGKPLAEHTNIDALEALSSGSLPLDRSELPPELLEAMSEQITAHYRQTLDEPIPMLNDKSPRECAKDPGLQSDVIAWLKYMENLNQRSPGSTYDFGWMWSELGLERD